MTSRSLAHLYLESLQERAYSLGYKFPSTTEETFRRAVDLLAEREIFPPSQEAKEWSKGLDTKTEVPTRFEDPTRYGVFMKCAQMIEEAARILSLPPIENRPLIGTLPTGLPNAMVIFVPPGEEYLIVLDPYVFDFSHRLSSIAARSLPCVDMKEGKAGYSLSVRDVKKNIAKTPVIARHFRELLLAYLFDESPGDVPRYVPEAPYASLASHLLSSMCLFVIGHEYGHLIGRHFSTDKTTLLPLLGENVEGVNFKWAQEVEADAFGLQLTLVALEKQGADLTMSYFGADYFLSCIEILERSISVVRTGKVKKGYLSPSHPPLQVRRDLLREGIKVGAKQFAEVPIKWGIALERALNILWEEEMLLALFGYHMQRTKLAPVWQNL